MHTFPPCHSPWKYNPTTRPTTINPINSPTSRTISIALFEDCGVLVWEADAEEVGEDVAVDVKGKLRAELLLVVFVVFTAADPVFNARPVMVISEGDPILPIWDISFNRDAHQRKI